MKIGIIDSGVLRNARMLEGLGDFIRFIIIGQQQGGYATISVNVLPGASSSRLGGRQASNNPHSALRKSSMKKA